MCVCQPVSSTSAHVYHFDITNPQFGVDDEKIDDLIENQLCLEIINYDQQSQSTKLLKGWTDLAKQIRERADYAKNISVYKESNSLYLFGTKQLVKDFQQNFQQLHDTYNVKPCKITLSERQVRYLHSFSAISFENDLSRLEYSSSKF